MSSAGSDGGVLGAEAEHPTEGTATEVGGTAADEVAELEGRPDSGSQAVVDAADGSSSGGAAAQGVGVSTLAGNAVVGSFTNGQWLELSVAPADTEDKKAEVADAERAFREDLAQLLGAETLIVLAGSGTSLCVQQRDGSRRAPSMRALWESVSALKEFSAVESKLSAPIVASKNLEHVLSDAQARQALDPSDNALTNFVTAAESVVLDACSFVDEDTDVNVHEVFLRKVARRSTRLQRTQLFTTNYDLVFEAAAQRARFSAVDGFGYGGQDFDGASFDLDFVRRRPHEELTLEPSVFHLLKLHGSVDWTMANSQVRKTTTRPLNPVLIYPSAAKFQMSYQQPYLEFMSRFQIALRQPDVGLILIGFGCNDDHLNAPIEAAIRGNIGLRAVVVSPGLRSAERSGLFEWMEDLICRGDRRLTLYEGGFDQFVQKLPDVPQQEERDAHVARLSASAPRVRR